jgi:hypothetical protein
MRPLLLLVALVAVAAPAAGASEKRGFAFGRTGGSIRPFSVSIANDGTVRVFGAVEVARAKLTVLQVANLNRVASMARFTSLPERTTCPGVLPDMATTFIRVGARVVRVHGSCVARYTRLWKALGAAVKLSSA